MDVGPTFHMLIIDFFLLLVVCVRIIVKVHRVFDWFSPTIYWNPLALFESIKEEGWKWDGFHPLCIGESHASIGISWFGLTTSLLWGFEKGSQYNGDPLDWQMMSHSSWWMIPKIRSNRASSGLESERELGYFIAFGQNWCSYSRDHSQSWNIFDGNISLGLLLSGVLLHFKTHGLFINQRIGLLEKWDSLLSSLIAFLIMCRTGSQWMFRVP